VQPNKTEEIHLELIHLGLVNILWKDGKDQTVSMSDIA